MVHWTKLITLVDTQNGINLLDTCILHGEIQRLSKKRDKGRITISRKHLA